MKSKCYYRSSKCCYRKCTNSGLEGYPMFSFPVNDPERLEVWLSNSANPFLRSFPEKKLAHCKLCVEHFKPSSVHYATHRTRLLGPAVPFKYVEEAEVLATTSNQLGGDSTDLTKVSLDQSYSIDTNNGSIQQPDGSIKQPAGSLKQLGGSVEKPECSTDIENFMLDDSDITLMNERVCCVSECNEGNGVLYRFPDPKTRTKMFWKWVKTIKGEIWDNNYDPNFIYKNRRVCYKHFDSQHIYANGRLCYAAIPTMFLNGGTTTFSWKKNSDTEAVDVDDLSVSEKHDDIQLVPDGLVRCGLCLQIISGLRCVCLTCLDLDMCVCCSKSDTHAQHYALRVPRSATQCEVREVLQKIRRALLEELNEPSVPNQCDPLITIKLEVKEEPEEEDPSLVENLNKDVDPLNVRNIVKDCQLLVDNLDEDVMLYEENKELIFEDIPKDSSKQVEECTMEISPVETNTNCDEAKMDVPLNSDCSFIRNQINIISKTDQESTVIQDPLENVLSKYITTQHKDLEAPPKSDLLGYTKTLNPITKIIKEHKNQTTPKLKKNELKNNKSHLDTYNLKAKRLVDLIEKYQPGEYGMKVYCKKNKRSKVNISEQEKKDLNSTSSGLEKNATEAEGT